MNAINPHPAGCFWHDWAERFGPPNIKWCEPTVCALVSEPANTWSNLAYLVVAGVCFALWLRRRNPTVAWFAPTAAIMGTFSLLYHMSNIFPGQLLDFVGMFFWVGLMLAIDLRRCGWLGRGGGRLFYWLFVVGMSILVWGLYRLDFPFQLLIAGLALLLIAFEIALWRRARPPRHRVRWFAVAVVLLALAEGFSLLDVNRIWCQPDNAFWHGHVVWHLLSALAVLPAFLHFRQFELDRDRA